MSVIPFDRDIKALSLFTGAGGLDLGFEAAGVKPLCCIENDENCRRTLELNRPEWPVLSQGDIEKIVPINLRNELGVQPGDLDLIFGGPPCQPFSKSAQWARPSDRPFDDSRTKPLLKVGSLVRAFLPRAVVLENVPSALRKGGFLSTTVTAFFHRLNATLGMHYTVSQIECDAVDFGTPQRRKRAFLIALRNGESIEDIPARFEPHEHRNCWDAFSGLSLDEKEKETLSLRGKWADLLPSIPEGHNYLYHTERGNGSRIFGYRTRYWNFLLKLSRTLPAWTVQASPGPSTGPFHWENRQLSIAELKRLQGFPDGFRLFGSYADQRRQLGNAVPTQLAHAVAETVLRKAGLPVIKNNHPDLVNKNNDLLQPDKILPVPEKYLSRIGEHPPHPGTGLGPGAFRSNSTVIEPSELVR